MPPTTKTKRNARIVRLRDHGFWPRNGKKTSKRLSWADVTATIGMEFPEDKISRSRVRFIYMRETK